MLQKIDTIIQVLAAERDCILRQDTPKCNHDCYNCDLLLPTQKIIDVYNDLILHFTEKKLNDDEDYCSD